MIEDTIKGLLTHIQASSDASETLKLAQAAEHIMSLKKYFKEIPDPRNKEV